MAAGSISTPNDLIALALKTAGVIGVGQTPDADDTMSCWIVLNAMIGEWQRKRYLVENLIDVSHQSTGALSYTIGAGGDFNTTRPDKLNAAYARLATNNPQQPFDFPLSLIYAREDYSALTLKHLSTFPYFVFYDSAYPLGSVYFWPVPNTQWELHLVVKNTLPTFTSLAQTIALPPEYINLLLWNLTARIRPLYQLPADPVIIGLAKDALATVRAANTQIPQLSMPGVLMGGTQFDVTLGQLNGLPWAV